MREIQSRCAEDRSGATSYELFEKNGFQFGDSFRGMARVWRRDGEALGEIETDPPTALSILGEAMHDTSDFVTAVFDWSPIGAAPRPEPRRIRHHRG